MTLARRRRDLLAPSIVVGVVFAALFAFTPVDELVQDSAFDSARGRWLVDADAPLLRALFYTGPKVALGLVAVALVVLVAGKRVALERLGIRRSAAAVALLTLASVPALAALGKRTTNVHCPCELARYGGDVPHVGWLERFRAGRAPTRRGRCFPAGHASGGFALVGLAWLRDSIRWRRAWIAASLCVGWTMGLYQVGKGAHWLSHTLASMVLSWIVATCWLRLLGSPSDAAAA